MTNLRLLSRPLVWLVPVVVLAALVILFNQWSSKEPMYRGERLSRWLDGSARDIGKVKDLYSGIGLEAIPWLLEEAVKEPRPPGPLENRYINWYLKSNRAIRFLPEPRSFRAYRYRDNSMALLIRLAPQSGFEQKIADVVGPFFISQLKNPGTFDYGLGILKSLGTNVGPALYREAMREADPIIRPVSVALEEVDPVLYSKFEREKRSAVQDQSVTPVK